MQRNPPSCRQRKGSDQAMVTLTDAVTKERRDYWLGRRGTFASRERYHRLLAEWEAADRRLPQRVCPPTPSDSPADRQVRRFVPAVRCLLPVRRA